jgi:peptidoglycan/xylan/chitin deacetylase (PgdA/CDA1 family)
MKYRIIRHIKLSCLAGTLFLLCFIPQRAAADNVTLCYHKFSYAFEDLYAITPEVFEWQIKYIKGQKIPIIRVTDLVSAYVTKTAVGDNVLLTADDGWKSQLNILPVLEKEKAPMTLYIYPLVIHDKQKQYMTPAELRSIRRNPWLDFGCHSYDHISMKKLNDKSLQRQVVSSRLKLDRLLGRELPTFAYPYGVSDKKAEKFTMKYYKLAFGVNGAVNTKRTPRKKLNRFLIYKNTTLGEFMDIVQRAKGKKYKKPYSIKLLGVEPGSGGVMEYAKAKVWKWEAKKKNGRAILLVPGFSAGPGWLYNLIKLFNENGFNVYMATARVDNMLFYTQDEISAVKDIGLEQYREDLMLALAHMTAVEDRMTVLTWGSGFDVLIDAMLGASVYGEKIKGIIAINPSFYGNNGDQSVYKKNIEDFGAMLAGGHYSGQDIGLYMRIKSLSDIAVLDPDGQSKYSERLGYSPATNMALLPQVFHAAGWADTGIDNMGVPYTADDFKNAFMQPLPLFTLAVPVKLLQDLNTLWYGGDFSEGRPHAVKCRASYIYSKYYADNVKSIKKTFPEIQVTGEALFPDMSTIELMLSKDSAAAVTTAAAAMM